MAEGRQVDAGMFSDHDLASYIRGRGSPHQGICLDADLLCMRLLLSSRKEEQDTCA
jgi:hypothetical protein